MFLPDLKSVIQAHQGFLSAFSPVGQKERPDLSDVMGSSSPIPNCPFNDPKSCVKTTTERARIMVIE